MFNTLNVTLEDGHKTYPPVSLLDGSRKQYASHSINLYGLLKLLISLLLSPMAYEVNVLIKAPAANSSSLPADIAKLAVRQPRHPDLANLDDDLVNELFLIASGMEEKDMLPMLGIEHSEFSRRRAEVFKHFNVHKAIQLCKRAFERLWFT